MNDQIRIFKDQKYFNYDNIIEIFFMNMEDFKFIDIRGIYFFFNEIKKEEYILNLQLPLIKFKILNRIRLNYLTNDENYEINEMNINKNIYNLFKFIYIKIKNDELIFYIKINKNDMENNIENIDKILEEKKKDFNFFLACYYFIFLVSIIMSDLIKNKKSYFKLNKYNKDHKVYSRHVKDDKLNDNDKYITLIVKNEENKEDEYEEEDKINMFNIFIFNDIKYNNFTKYIYLSMIIFIKNIKEQLIYLKNDKSIKSTKYILIYNNINNILPTLDVSEINENIYYLNILFKKKNKSKNIKKLEYNDYNEIMKNEKYLYYHKILNYYEKY
jgi:hypothetical protein